MYFLIDFLRETLIVLFETAPFLIFGFFLAGLVKVLIPMDWLSRHLGRRNFRSVFMSALIGVPLPLCSCSVLPVATTLRRSGASKGATVSFLIATPESGIDSISITYALLDPIMTVARPATAFVTAMVGGLSVNVLEGPDGETTPAAGGPSPASNGPAPLHAPDSDTSDMAPARDAAGDDGCGSDCDCACSDEPTLSLKPRRTLAGTLRESAQYGFGPLLDDIGPYLLIGFLLTGLISSILPDGALENPALRGLPAMLMMLAIGIPLYVCATASTPIVAALIAKGLNPGAGLVFMLAGPATNAASLTVLWKMLGRRTLIIYLATIAVVSIAAGLILDEIYAASGIDPRAVLGAGSRIIPRWIEVVTAVAIVVLLIRSLMRTRQLAKWREQLRRIGRPLGIDLGGRLAMTVAIIVIVILYLLSGCSIVHPGEMGWTLSFGRITRTVDQPGLVVHAPYPFEIFVKERPQAVRSIDRGYRQGQPFPVSADRQQLSDAERSILDEAEVVTGDEALLSVRYSIQYAIADAYAYRFGIADPQTLLTACGDYAIRRVMCESNTDAELVGARARTEEAIAVRMQAELDALAAGIRVLRVDLIDVHAPPEVHFAFRDVASALEDYERFIRQAESYQTRTVAAARGQSFRDVANAEGTKARQTATAQGDAQAFRTIETATRSTRELTRLRLYLDAATTVLPAARLIIPLTDMPLDLWLRQEGATRTWPEPIGSGSAAPSTPAPAGNAAPAAPPSSETWREKLERLQEKTR